MNAKLRRWISQQPCALCEFFWTEFGKQPQCPQETIVDHHLIPESGGTRKSVDENNIIPVGYNHHTGPHGVHTRYVKKEKELMEELRKIAKMYTDKFLTFSKKHV